jgi:hypothetical protein
MTDLPVPREHDRDQFWARVTARVEATGVELPAAFILAARDADRAPRHESDRNARDS